jgi:hypothetical protein
MFLYNHQEWSTTPTISHNMFLRSRQKILEMFCQMKAHSPKALPKRKVQLPCNRPWRLIGLWHVEVAILSRRSAHRWRCDCQPYAPATFYPQVSWYSFLLEAELTPGPYWGWKDLVKWKIHWPLREIKPAIFRLVDWCLNQLRHRVLPERTKIKKPQYFRVSFNIVRTL